MMRKFLLLFIFMLLIVYRFSGEESKSSLPTIYITGDSTVHITDGIQGWGDAIDKYFDAKKVKVINCAVGGKSSRSFRNEGYWGNMLKEVKPGDWVFIQFGHNDTEKIEEKSKKGRGTLEGIGGQTVDSANTQDGKVEAVHTYGWYLTQDIKEAKAKGANVVVFSPVPRNQWDGNKFMHVLRNYAVWASEVASRENVYFVDLEDIVSKHFIKLGKKKVSTFFPVDTTHSGPEGADFNAQCVIEGLKGIKNIPVVNFLK